MTTAPPALDAAEGRASWSTSILPAAALTAAVVMTAATASGAGPFPPAACAITFALAATIQLSRRSRFVGTIVNLLALWHLAGIALATLAGQLPAAWQPWLPTAVAAMLPGVVAIACLAFSKAPVVRDVVALADPYFDDRHRGSAWRAGRGRPRLSEGQLARLLMAGLMSLNALQVLLTVWLNQWNGRFFTALQQRDGSAFWTELRTWAFLAGLTIATRVYETYLRQYAQMQWRRWLTERMTGAWLTTGRSGTAPLDGKVDNPDQRVAEDAQRFAAMTLDLWSRFFTAGLSLYAFVIILWGLSATVTFQIGGFDLALIPGHLVWAALAFALISTAAAHCAGHPLVGIEAGRQKVEADFRVDLIRLQENDEQIAAAKGGRIEARRLKRRFEPIARNWAAYMRQVRLLMLTTSSIGQISTVFPLAVVAPAYFAGKVQLGALTQMIGAFFRVQDALSLVTELYRSLAEYKAVLDRLQGFIRAAADRPAHPRQCGALTIARDAEGAGLTIHDGHGHFFPGRNLHLRPGDRVLVKGPLARRDAFLHALVQGSVEAAPPIATMRIEARPYLPIGTLREAVSYPRPVVDSPEQDAAAALAAVDLSHLVADLDRLRHWDKELSGGELQRLAVARLIVNRPALILLDGATGAIDAAGHRTVHEALRRRLPNAIVIATDRFEDIPDDIHMVVDITVP